MWQSIKSRVSKSSLIRLGRHKPGIIDYTNQGSGISFFDYAFLEVKDLADTDNPEETLQKMNVWMLSNPAKPGIEYAPSLTI
jgi:hypothetical protein